MSDPRDESYRKNLCAAPTMQAWHCIKCLHDPWYRIHVLFGFDEATKREEFRIVAPCGHGACSEQIPQTLPPKRVVSAYDPEHGCDPRYACACPDLEWL